MEKKRSFSRGVWPVALTPFRENGAIDFDGYAALLDYYLEHRVTGLFCVCLSSELYQLSPEERLELARFSVRRIAGKVPVVGCGGFGSTFSERIDSIRMMADTGLDAVVIPACAVVPREASDRQFREEFLRILDASGDIRLGLYECPLPYHRLISAGTLRELALGSGSRLGFLKDTCCDRTVIGKRLDACSGSALALYNANLTTLLDSLRAGAAGYSGTSANFYPELLAELCDTFESDPARADRMQLFFNLIQRHVEFKYPRGAKLFLAMCGVPITDYCRVGCESFTADQFEHLKALYESVKLFKSEYSVTP